MLINISNEIETIENVVNSILEIKTNNDFVYFDLKSCELIQELQKYSGIRVHLIGKIGNTKTPLSLDIGVGDQIVPHLYLRKLRVLLDENEKPSLLTYSLETIIAEKLDAIIYFMEANGRMKDFYDIYYLAKNYNFDSLVLRNAMAMTFRVRESKFEMIVLTQLIV